MVHSLKALRSNRDDILTTLQVFVEDPLVEWTDRASKDTKKRGGEFSEVGPAAEATRDFCKRLIDTAGKKLDMFNPAFVMESDLSANAFLAGEKRKKYRAGAVSAINGSAGNVRYEALKHGPQCSSVSEQVDCLVDMATDPNILARTYFGWDAWA
jgi:DNA-dependent protein kinase catalytic subunit